jgi:hypothetical protein
LCEFTNVNAEFVVEGIQAVVRKSFISIPGHGCKMYGYLNECKHEYIISFLLDVMDTLANAAEVNLPQKERYLRWYELLDKLYLRLRQKPVAYDDKPAE